METTNMTQAQNTYVELNETELLNGMVKWFDEKKGFGFITSLKNNDDIFVHHSGLRPQTDNCWKTLIQGEYVQFQITPSKNGKIQAAEVKGIQGGKLLCEHTTNRFGPRQTYKGRNDEQTGECDIQDDS